MKYATESPLHYLKKLRAGSPRYVKSCGLEAAATLTCIYKYFAKFVYIDYIAGFYPEFWVLIIESRKVYIDAA